MKKKTLNSKIESLTEFARMMAWSAAWDVARAIRDLGRASENRHIYKRDHRKACEQLEFIVRHAKSRDLLPVLLPTIRETIQKYRR